MTRRYTANSTTRMCHLGYADTIEDARALLLRDPGEQGYVHDTRLHCTVWSTARAELHRREDEEYRMNEDRALGIVPVLLSYPESGAVLRVVDNEGRLRTRSGEWINCFTMLPEDKPHWGL